MRSTRATSVTSSESSGTIAGPPVPMRFEHPHGTGPPRRIPSGAVRFYDQASINSGRRASREDDPEVGGRGLRRLSATLLNTTGRCFVLDQWGGGAANPFDTSL